jgi:hypothetical protein
MARTGTGAADYYYYYAPGMFPGVSGFPGWPGKIVARAYNPAVSLGGLSGQPLVLNLHGYNTPPYLGMSSSGVNPPTKWLMNPAKNLIAGAYTV